MVTLEKDWSFWVSKGLICWSTDLWVYCWSWNIPSFPCGRGCRRLRMIGSIKKQILGGIIWTGSTKFIVVRTRIHFNKIIYKSNIKTPPSNSMFLGLRVDRLGTLNKKKRSMEKAIESCEWLTQSINFTQIVFALLVCYSNSLKIKINLIPKQ
jgi:hypothetical protein